MGTQVKIGQICLAKSSGADSERFASLIEALAQHDVEQHVLVANLPLAQRLAGCPGVTVGPVVKTPVMAYCLMPEIDLAHVHEVKSGQAGLLLTLTRSVPFVITSNDEEKSIKNPLTRSVFHRASSLIPVANDKPSKQIAEEHLRIYRDTVTQWMRAALML